MMTGENNESMNNNSVSLNWYPFEPKCPPMYYVFLQGIFAPLIIIISTILNSLIAVVLLQKHLRSPTNILLLAIALYDTLTGLFPFPVYIFIFTFRQCKDYVPYNYGWFHRINHDLLPFIFHTCSIWVKTFDFLFTYRFHFFFLRILDYGRFSDSTLYLCLSFGKSKTLVYSENGIKGHCLCQCFSTYRCQSDVLRGKILRHAGSIFS